MNWSNPQQNSDLVQNTSQCWTNYIHPQGSHSHGKSWKILEKKWSWKVMEKSWKIAKIQIVMKICLPGKKSWKSVVQIRLYRVPQPYAKTEFIP